MVDAAYTENLRKDLDHGFINQDQSSPQVYHPKLIANDDSSGRMLDAIKEALSKADEFFFSVAFVTTGGLAVLKQALVDFKGKGTIITSRYQDFNSPEVLRELMALKKFDVYVHDNPDIGFHAKGYIFKEANNTRVFIGSSNLTARALMQNREWNVEVSAAKTSDFAHQLDAVTSAQHKEAQLLTESWIQNYEKSRRPRAILPPVSQQQKIQPNLMQVDALTSLQRVIDSGAKRSLVISATGTGKTILSALAARNFQPRRMLFVVHREQILDAAIEAYQRVFEADASEFGKLTGGKWEPDKRFVFATIQTLSRPERLKQLAADHFDLIVMDEVHRAGATSYQALFNHFTPRFTLGITATPERTDGISIYQLFDYNVAYEIRLQRALEENMLAPFHYYGVTDFIDANSNTVTDTSQLVKLANEERVDYVVTMLEKYGFTSGVKGLIFCSGTEEAKALSALFNERKVFGKQLRTYALDGTNSIAEREAAVAKLQRGELDYLLTVDIFNEGVDIPEVNQIVMLRCTKSAIIFTQQLGRGLRKAPGKSHLRVIDFIGNYQNNYLIPIALFGDNSRNKDSLRKRIVSGKGNERLGGLSTVNFDEISRHRILDAISNKSLDTINELKKEVDTLRERLGRIPALYDFAQAETVDPLALVTRAKNYWALLLKGRFIDSLPSKSQYQRLNFLSGELLPGVRPHELLVLRELLQGGELSRAEMGVLFKRNNLSYSDATIKSVIGVLTLQFYKKAATIAAFGGPLIDEAVVGSGRYRLAPELLADYRATQVPRQLHADKQIFHPESFADHVDDIIRTGLWRCRQQQRWGSELQIGQRYSRRDALRMLGWDYNGESTVYGYKPDDVSRTCPIFVTYHKADDIEASTKYEDEFTSPETLHWFTRSRRTLASPEVQRTIAADMERHLFVKKDDEEGTDFFYLGTVQPEGATNRQMPDKEGEPLNVVSMDLHLDSPVEQSLMDYLTAKSSRGERKG